jgi:hypothetical protein
MKKEDNALRILEEPHVVAENGWIKLSPLLMKSLGIEPGDLISFLADEEGFRVKGGKKPPYFHTSTEIPPSTLPVTPQQGTPKTDTAARLSETTQLHLFEPGQPKKLPQTRRRRPH